MAEIMNRKGSRADAWNNSIVGERKRKGTR